MARSSSKDPLDKFRWKVTIDGFQRAGFSAVDVPNISIKTTTYPEGGAHLFPRQILDTVTYKPVTLIRGVSTDKDFYNWIISPLQIITPSTDPTLTSPDLVGGYRKNVVINHLDRSNRTIRTYTLYDAWPIEYAPASDFAADGDDSLSMEKITLAYESFSVSIQTPSNSPFDTSDILNRLIRNA
jgi:phage tail-like protein